MNTESRTWWHSAVVYQVYPRSFLDANGDGLGDLAGVESKLDYLKDLGVDAIWLSPFYPSPQHDSGYDVANPRDVDPMYGDLDAAQSLIDSAHAAGLRIIIDLVPNHVSQVHPWFQAALNSEPGSPERARFHFVDTKFEYPPNNWVSMFGGPAWTRTTNPDGSLGQWYLHVFDSSQPDLNWTNPEVAADWIETLEFWLDRGVDGFRVDVAHGLVKDVTYADLPDPVGLTEALRFDLDDGSPQAAERRLLIENSGFFDRDELQDIYRTWREVLDRYPGDRMAVSEAWVPVHRAGRYVSPTSLHQIFGFDFLVVAFDAPVMQATISQAIAAVAAVNAPPTWALSNHDSPRVVSRLTPPDADLSDQHRHFIGFQRARALAVVAHALPGSMYVYQGEELGLSDVDLPDAARQDPVFFRTRGEQKGRDGARVPLPWSGSNPPFGFTDSDHPTWLPQPSQWAVYSVEAQLGAPQSMLNLYRNTLHQRRELSGEIKFLESGNHKVMIFRRDRGFHCAINTGDTAYEFPAEMRGGVVLVASDSTMDGNAEVLSPNAAIWFRCAY